MRCCLYDLRPDRRICSQPKWITKEKGLEAFALGESVLTWITAVYDKGCGITIYANILVGIYRPRSYRGRKWSIAADNNCFGAASMLPQSEHPFPTFIHTKPAVIRLTIRPIGMCVCVYVLAYGYCISPLGSCPSVVYALLVRRIYNIFTSLDSCTLLS